jgi:glucose-1-phosphate thymidylyltransferase
VGDKPLIDYSISVLMLAGIREIILICNESDLSNYLKLFGNGSELGLVIEYVIQPQAEWLPQLGSETVGVARKDLNRYFVGYYDLKRPLRAN